MKLHLPLGFLAAVLATFISPVYAEDSFVFPEDILFEDYSADQSGLTATAPTETNWHVTGTNNGTNTTEWIKGIIANGSDYLHVESGNFRNTKVDDADKKFYAIQGAKIGTVIGIAGDKTDGPTVYGMVCGSPLVNATNNPWLRIESGTFYNNVGAAFKLGDQKAPGTVSLIINGGTFTNDVTGVMSTSTQTTFFGNTNIVINGGIFGTFFGIYGGTASDSQNFQSMVGNASVTIQGSSTKIMFAVGGHRITQATKGDPIFTGNTEVKLINGATANGLVGGNAYLSDSKTDKSKVEGNTNILVDGGVIKSSGLINGLVGGSICGTVTARLRLLLKEILRCRVRLLAVILDGSHIP